jgi:glucose-6-phosphate-specific signal transduction histidine kinase
VQSQLPSAASMCAAAAAAAVRAARQELQRLEASVGKSERLAQNVLADLRSIRQARATELRSEVGSRADDDEG